MILYWILACLFAGTTAQICGKGPCAGQQFGALIPDPTNCARFYQCTSFNETLKDCPQGTYFSAYHRVCVFPLQANCTLGGEEPSVPCPGETTPGGGIVVTPTPPVTETTIPWAPIIEPCTSHEPEFYPNNENCTIYTYCCSGIPIPMYCKDGEYYSVPDRKCIEAEECPQTTTPTTPSTEPPTTPTTEPPTTPSTEPPTTPTTEPPITPSTEQPTTPTTEPPITPYPPTETPTTPSIQAPCTGLEAETIEDPDDCTQYTYCDMGVPTIVECPVGEYFSKDDNACIEAEECPGDGGSKPVIIPPCTSLDPEIHGDPEDCGRYTYCENGIPHIVQCAIGEYFSEEERACIEAEMCPTKPGVKPPCTSEEAEIVADPDDCTRYFYCYNGNPLIVQCPIGEYFSKEHQGCIKSDTCPGNGGGGSTSTTTEVAGTSPTTSKPITPPCTSLESETWEYPEDCSKFYSCVEGKPFVVSCKPGTYYSKEHDGCIVASECPSEGGTGSTQSPPTTVTTESPITLPCTSDNPEIHANPEDCTQYFYCYLGSPYVVQCPVGSYFSQQNKTCIQADQCPADVETTTTSNTEIPESTTSAPITSPCTSLDPEVWGDPDDCTRYTYCYLGIPHIVQCAIGEYFSEEYGVCIETSECPGTAGTTANTTPSTGETPTCETEIPTPPITTPTAPTIGTDTTPPWTPIVPPCTSHEPEFYPNKTDCTRYIYCCVGIPVAMQCDIGEYFSMDDRMCIRTDECPQGTTTAAPTRPTKPPTTAPTTIPTTQPSTEPTHSPTTEPTTFPTTEPTTTAPTVPTQPTMPTTEPTTTPNLMPPCTSLDAQTFPVSDNCTKYIYCFAGIPYNAQCANGQFYSQEANGCIVTDQCPQ